MRFVVYGATALYRTCRWILVRFWSSLGDQAPARSRLVRRQEAAVFFQGHQDLLAADDYLNQWYRD